jgi:Trk K+ transport system NAD-binding subunit
MKFLATQVTYFLSQNQTRQNIKALFKYVLFLIGVIIVFTILFHFIMLYAEGKEFSWITGFYWTLTVMSTLGFGDITFESDIGRLFSIVVMLSGTILLLIMLPFAFIRFFYAPWLEAQIHTQAPRELPEDTKGHVIICKYDSIARNLIKRLNHNKIPYFVIEEDSSIAAQLYQDDVSVVCGNVDSRKTYERLRAKNARLIFANAEDTTNTNITLTIREIAPDVPIAAIAGNFDSIDILELSGATHVLPLKHTLGEHLANRIGIGKERTKVIGEFDGWQVFEFTVYDTNLKGKKLNETNFRKTCGINVIGVWEKGHLLPANPEMVLSEYCVPVAVGTKRQISKLEKTIIINEVDSGAVLILGGGKVGRAAARSLKKKSHKVFMVDQNRRLRGKLKNLPDRLVIGDAADRETLIEAGLEESSLVILSTNDDAVNIYLSIYCRRLKPDIRIVCRITHERNLEAIHRAGADFVLSYAPLGSESIISIIQNRNPIIMGEGVEFFTVDLPQSLAGKTLAESQIGSKTGMIVLAIREDGKVMPNPLPDKLLSGDCKLNILGTTEQLQNFKEAF